MNYTITITPGPVELIDSVYTVLSSVENDDYYAYERGPVWYVGIGSLSSLQVDPQGETATISTGGKKEVRPVNGSITKVLREYISAQAEYGRKVFGYVGFNYAAYIRGISYNVGGWPLVGLLIPRTEITFHPDQITITGFDEREVEALRILINGAVCMNAASHQDIDTEDTAEEYTTLVKNVLREIAQGIYTKVIPSRAVNLGRRVDIPATLRCGRHHNNPARTFCFSHSLFQAVGFSPELVMAVRGGKVTTEPLAGTRSGKGTETEVERLRRELLSDPKEIVEHVLSVKEAIEELNRVSVPDSVVMDDLMSVRPRGSVQHLGSSVSGTLSPEKDVWDAFNILFPSITASGIPKLAAIEAIQRLEHRPRELYAGAVLMMEDSRTLEAALVLRSIYQDGHRQWAQAGAGVIIQSCPTRELEETCEKLASIVPYVVPERRSSS